MSPHPWPDFDEHSPIHQQLYSFLCMDVQCAPSQISALQQAIEQQQGCSAGNLYHYRCDQQGILIESLYDEDERAPTTIPYPLAQHALDFWRQQCSNLGNL